MTIARYETILDPSPDDLAPIGQGIHQFNRARLGEEVYGRYHRFALLAKDDNNRVIGGLRGKLMWDWLYIEALWVAEEAGNQGIGSRLLTMAEELAISKEFSKSHLETTDFQALNFYLNRGYEIFGTLEDKPMGSNWYFLKKELLPAATVPGS